MERDGLEVLFVNGVLNVKQSVKAVIGFIWHGTGNTIMSLIAA